jgi:hypothetical protein
MPALVRYIKYLEKNGSRIVFFSTFDPRISNLPLPRSLVNFLLSGFPGIEYFENIDEAIPIYHHEGIHLLDASGLMYFNQLMKKTGLPQSANCRIVLN